MATALLSPDRDGVCPLSVPVPDVAHGIISQALLTAPGLRATLFQFAAGQELSEHTSPARVLVQVLSGRCEFLCAGTPRLLGPGELLHLPPNLPHAVRAPETLTLLVIQATSPQA
jgi:quercetin dioxygenase-like cupin family protein